jgi:hypothetical protein
MTASKPLHVQVAEALGWRNVAPGGLLLPDNHVGDPPGLIGATAQVPRYDRDWSVTGPLIDQYGITLESPYSFIPSYPRDSWIARWAKYCKYPHYADPATQNDTTEQCVCLEADGDTPLIAVCNLVLKISAAGRLR